MRTLISITFYFFTLILKEIDDVAPAERNVTPADVIDFTNEDESIHIIGAWGGKVTRIARLSGMRLQAWSILL